ICHANLQIVLETFSHAQPASKYSLSNGAETALTLNFPVALDISSATIAQGASFPTEYLSSRDRLRVPPRAHRRPPGVNVAG
ncbi:hypothetical protein CN213_35295, partial [Sinorhizobium meliloti]